MAISDSLRGIVTAFSVAPYTVPYPKDILWSHRQEECRPAGFGFGLPDPFHRSTGYRLSEPRKVSLVP